MRDEVRHNFVMHGLRRLTKALATKGELSERDFDQAGVPKSEKIRDSDRKMHCKRACILTNKRLYAAQIKKQEEEEEKRRNLEASKEARRIKRLENKEKKAQQEKIERTSFMEESNGSNQINSGVMSHFYC